LSAVDDTYVPEELFLLDIPIFVLINAPYVLLSRSHRYEHPSEALKLVYQRLRHLGGCGSNMNHIIWRLARRPFPSIASDNLYSSALQGRAMLVLAQVCIAKISQGFDVVDTRPELNISVCASVEQDKEPTLSLQAVLIRGESQQGTGQTISSIHDSPNQTDTATASYV
jgi:hypothetical protein